MSLWRNNEGPGLLPFFLLYTQPELFSFHRDLAFVVVVNTSLSPKIELSSLDCNIIILRFVFLLTPPLSTIRTTTQTQPINNNKSPLFKPYSPLDLFSPPSRQTFQAFWLLLARIVLLNTLRSCLVFELQPPFDAHAYIHPPIYSLPSPTLRAQLRCLLRLTVCYLFTNVTDPHKILNFFLSLLRTSFHASDCADVVSSWHQICSIGTSPSYCGTAIGFKVSSVLRI